MRAPPSPRRMNMEGPAPCGGPCLSCAANGSVGSSRQVMKSSGSGVRSWGCLSHQEAARRTEGVLKTGAAGGTNPCVPGLKRGTASPLVCPRCHRAAPWLARGPPRVRPPPPCELGRNGCSRPQGGSGATPPASRRHDSGSARSVAAAPGPPGGCHRGGLAVRATPRPPTPGGWDGRGQSGVAHPATGYPG
jgi:hypothetical protein